MFFLHGGDDFRKSAAAKLLLDRYADSATRDFNLDLIEGSETSVERLASVIATPPMMAEWRVVHLKEAEALAGSPSARKVILDTAKNPPPGLVLILQATVPAKSRAKFYKDLARVATAVEFKPVPADEVPGWLVSWAREEAGVTVEIDAARALAGAAGTELGMLTLEVRKLAEMVGEGAPVDVRAVRKGGLRLPSQDRWAWFDLVGNRQIREAAARTPDPVGTGRVGGGTRHRSVDPPAPDRGGHRGRPARVAVRAAALPTFPRPPDPRAGQALDAGRSRPRGAGALPAGPALEGQRDPRRGPDGGVAARD